MHFFHPSSADGLLPNPGEASCHCSESLLKPVQFFYPKNSWQNLNFSSCSLFPCQQRKPVLLVHPTPEMHQELPQSAYSSLCSNKPCPGQPWRLPAATIMAGLSAERQGGRRRRWSAVDEALKRTQPIGVHGTWQAASKAAHALAAALVRTLCHLWRVLGSRRGLQQLEEGKSCTYLQKRPKAQPGEHKPVSLTLVPGRITELVLQEHFSSMDDVYINFTRLLTLSPAIFLHPSEDIMVWMGGQLVCKNCLDGWAQRVAVNGPSSTWRPVTSGVQQAYVLGPVQLSLFNPIWQLGLCNRSVTPAPPAQEG